MRAVAIVHLMCFKGECLTLKATLLYTDAQTLLSFGYGAWNGSDRCLGRRNFPVVRFQYFRISTPGWSPVPAPQMTRFPIFGGLRVHSQFGVATDVGKFCVEDNFSARAEQY